MQIPSNKNFRSNLSHSLIIIAYVVSEIIAHNKKSFKRSKKIKNASKKDINNVLSLYKKLEERHFLSIEKKPIMIENLRNIF